MEHINSAVRPGALETIGQVFHFNMDTGRVYILLETC